MSIVNIQQIWCPKPKIKWSLQHAIQMLVLKPLQLRTCVQTFIPTTNSVICLPASP